MKLAEALSLRKDLQKRIEQIKTRLNNNVKVQEGENPQEDPKNLEKELDGCLKQLETIIFKINSTNMATVVDGKTLTELMAKREVLTKRIEVMRETFNTASELGQRYSRTEIKMIPTIDVSELGKRIDKLSQQWRELDYKIQAANFSTELL